MQFTEELWKTPQSPQQDKADGEIGWFVSALIVLGLVAVLVAPAVYVLSQTGLLEKTIVVSTLAAVLATHVIKTFGR